MTTEATDFQIDKDSLDYEWTRQPDLVHGYATRLARAKLLEQRRKNLFEVGVAELTRKIRKSPDAYGLPAKPTEAAVKEAATTSKTYSRLLLRVNKARHRCDMLQAACTALDHKKRALENLVHLHTQDYYSAPRAKAGKSASDTFSKRRAHDAGISPKTKEERGQ